MGPTMKIQPRCLAFNTRDNKGAAYTSDGFMLPCCWMDDPPVYRYVKACGLKDEELLLSNNKNLDDIFTSDQWENFFQTLLTLGKIYNYIFLLENLNILKSWEQIKGAKKPVKKTSAKIFLKLVIKIKELLSEKFLKKICKK